MPSRVFICDFVQFQVSEPYTARNGIHKKVGTSLRAHMSYVHMHLVTWWAFVHVHVHACIWDIGSIRRQHKGISGKTNANTDNFFFEMKGKNVTMQTLLLESIVACFLFKQ